jgi:hypothetical protein
MCGSATHPGGGIMGANGRIASQVILKEWKKPAAPRQPKNNTTNGAHASMEPVAPTAAGSAKEHN